MVQRIRQGCLRVALTALFLIPTVDDAGCRAVHAQQLTTQDRPVAEPPRLALVIGITRYPNLGASEQLHGCANDVAAIRRLLSERFRFKEINIKTLVDQEATAQAIRNALDGLIAQVKALPADGPIAQVVFHVSGHGSQVADQPYGDPDHDEEDGLDETIVPFDATRQGGREDIRDDEINAFVHQICAANKARIVVIQDTCHSGTGARGAAQIRQLPRPDLVPTASPKNAPAPVAKKLPPGAVFLSACRSSEVEPELSEADKTHGLFTRFLVEVLTEEKAVSRLSYDLLVKATVNRYRDRQIMQAPTPQLEGGSEAVHATVLGAGPDIDRPPYYEVQVQSDTKVRLAAGKFHDITVGSLFELYTNPEHIDFDGTGPKDRSRSVAWVRIASVDGASSEADVIKWDDDEKKYIESKLPAPRIGRGFAVERHHERGKPNLRLMVTRAQSDGTDGPPIRPDDPAVPQVIVEAIGGAQNTGEVPWLTWSSAASEPCHLVLRIDADYAAFFPSTGVAEVLDRDRKVASKIPRSLRGGWGPIELRSAGATKQIREYVRNITRATNLIGLAQRGEEAGAGSFRIKVELLKVKYKDDKILEINPWPPDPAGSITMRTDDGYAVRVTNIEENGKPVFVTVLLIGPNMEIKLILPDPDLGGEPIKLESSEHADSYELKCDASDFGKSHAVVFVTREPVNYGFVQQSALPTTRGAARVGAAGSLDQLLLEQTYFKPPATRGARLRPSQTDTSWHSQVLSWRAAP